MFEKPKKEISKEDKGGETIVGASVKLKGNLRSNNDIFIEGVVSGDIKTKGSVNIGQSADVVAGIKAKNVVVAGSVQGNVEAKDKLEITETGKVLGDIVTNILSITPGATFSGKSQMAGTHKEPKLEPVAEVDIGVKEEKEKSEKK